MARPVEGDGVRCDDQPKLPAILVFQPLWYNLTITAASVVVAIFIGGLGALGLIGDKLGLEGGLWGFVSELNDNLANFGYAVVGVFIASWLISALIYRAKGFDHLQAGQA